MYCKPQADSDGIVRPKAFGGRRRIDRILVDTSTSDNTSKQECQSKVEGYQFLTCLAGQTDHVPVALTLKSTWKTTKSRTRNTHYSKLIFFCPKINFNSKTPKLCLSITLWPHHGLSLSVRRSQRLPRLNFMDLYSGQMEEQTIVEKGVKVWKKGG